MPDATRGPEQPEGKFIVKLSRILHDFTIDPARVPILIFWAMIYNIWLRV